MRDGRIEQIGRPLEVYDHPANLFVAEFIGSPSMNLLRGEAVSIDGRPAFRSGDTTLPLPSTAAIAPGQSIFYGIRPEHLKPSTNGSGVPAKVSIVEPTGPEIHIYAEMAGVEVCSVTNDRVLPAPGSTIDLLPQIERVHLFDQDSGRSLHG
jgi:multiple sugar transport system ATP-binding protein